MVVTRQGGRIKKRIGGSQLPRWLPMIPHLLVFTPVYSFFPHCSGVGVCDQEHMAEWMECHFQGWVIKDCRFCLGCPLAFPLSWISHFVRSQCYIVSNLWRIPTWRHLQPTANEELRPANNQVSESGSSFYSPSWVLRWLLPWSTASLESEKINQPKLQVYTHRPKIKTSR